MPKETNPKLWERIKIESAWSGEDPYKVLYQRLANPADFLQWSFAYWSARREHVFRLRITDMTFRRIGERLGITSNRAAQLFWQYGREEREAAENEGREFSRWWFGRRV